MHTATVINLKAYPSWENQGYAMVHHKQYHLLWCQRHRHAAVHGSILVEGHSAACMCRHTRRQLLYLKGCSYKPAYCLHHQCLHKGHQCRLYMCGRIKLVIGCCRSQLLEFYASSGDFTRRLTSVKANGKFSSPSAGAQDYWTVSHPM